jgi:hypothetical protein
MDPEEKMSLEKQVSKTIGEALTTFRAKFLAVRVVSVNGMPSEEVMKMNDIDSTTIGTWLSKLGYEDYAINKMLKEIYARE